MKLFKLITVLSLVNCGGPEFSTLDTKFNSNNPEAGAGGQGESGEGGEDNSAGTSFAGGGSGNNLAGKDSGGNSNGGTGNSAGETSAGASTIGGAVQGGTAGTNSAGSNMAGAGGEETNECTSFGVKSNCAMAKYNGAPAPYQFECTVETDTPPEIIIVPEGNANTWRQCVESIFGSPSRLWCCTNP